MYMMLFTFVLHDLQKLILSYKNSDMHAAAGFSLIIDEFSASKMFYKALIEELISFINFMKSLIEELISFETYLNLELV